MPIISGIPPRKDITIAMLPGMAVVNSNDMHNSNVPEMLDEWFKDGETLTLVLTNPYRQITLTRNKPKT